MSNTYSYLAAQCEVEAMEKAFGEAWPTFEPVAAREQFATWEQAYRWASPRSGYLAGAHPNDVKLLFRDGKWSVLADFSLCMSDEREALAEFSQKLGRVVIATTQGTAGFAQFQLFEDGAAARSIIRVDGQTTEEGTPLPEEVGIPLDRFTFADLDALRRRFGLASFLGQEPSGPAWGLALIDHIPTAVPPQRPPKPKRAWWKLW